MNKKMISQTVCRLIALVIFACGTAQAKVDGRIQILLIGDSTTIGNQPRAAKPAGPNLEDIVKGLLAAETDLPPADVFNLGLGGDDIGELLTPDGRYDTTIATITNDVDYIFFRYGINDWFALGGNSGTSDEDMQSEFAANNRALIARLQADHPNAVIIPMTIIAFLNAERSELMNEVTRDIAAEQGLDVLDLYPVYYAYEQSLPRGALDVRQGELSAIDEKYHTMLEPYSSGDGVNLSDNELDPLFGDSVGWFNNHPNLAGYNLIGLETVKFLTPVIRARERATAIDAWKTTHFSASDLADPLVSGDDADPDGDGLSNLFEFALAQDPTIKSNQPVIIEPNETQIGVQYPLAESRPGITLRIDHSTDLETWTPTAISENGLSFVSLESGYTVDESTTPAAVILNVETPPNHLFLKILMEQQ